MFEEPTVLPMIEPFSMTGKGAGGIPTARSVVRDLYELARKVKSSWIFCNRERTQEEVEVQDNLERNLWSIGQEIRYSRGKMLYYTADLPFPVTHTPDTFTQFRKEVERFVTIRRPLPIPESFNSLSVRIEAGEIPTLAEAPESVHLRLNHLATLSAV